MTNNCQAAVFTPFFIQSCLVSLFSFTSSNIRRNTKQRMNPISIYCKYHKSIWQRATSFLTITKPFAKWLHCSNKTGWIQYLNMNMYCILSSRPAQSLSKLCVRVCMCVCVCSLVVTACHFSSLYFALKQYDQPALAVMFCCFCLRGNATCLFSLDLDVYIICNILCFSLAKPHCSGGQHGPFKHFCPQIAVSTEYFHTILKDNSTLVSV